MILLVIRGKLLLVEEVMSIPCPSRNKIEIL